jgi:hypothetical protein
MWRCQWTPVWRVQDILHAVLCHNPDGLTSWLDSGKKVDLLGCAAHVLFDTPIDMDVPIFEYQLDPLHILQYRDVL